MVMDADINKSLDWFMVMLADINKSLKWSMVMYAGINKSEEQIFGICNEIGYDLT